MKPKEKNNEKVKQLRQSGYDARAKADCNSSGEKQAEQSNLVSGMNHHINLDFPCRIVHLE
jgi:hypothetical protein